MDQSHTGEPRVTLRRSARVRRRPVRATLLTLLVVLSFTTGVGIDRTGWLGGGAAADTSFTSIPQFQILEETYSAIRAHYVDSKDVSDAQLLYGAASGMVNALGDTGHSTFLDPKEAKESEEELNGELTGIGVYVDSTGTQPVVIVPIPGSPADKAGIKPGDTIVAIDGKQTRETDPKQWTSAIRGGAPGTTVTLTVKHADATTTQDITIKRAHITVDPVSWRMLPGGVAWIELSEFSKGAGDQLAKSLTDAKAAGAKGIILDLRNDPGGYLNEADKVASQFLPKGSVLFEEKDAAGHVSDVKTTGANGEWLDGPLTVLINANSASAAEIVSASLQDNHRATLIGETTAGMGTVLVPYDLSDGSQAVLGVAIFLAPSGQQIWKKGVQPDDEVGLKDGTQTALVQEFKERSMSAAQLQATHDAQLQAGYAHVAKAITAAPATPPAPS